MSNRVSIMSCPDYKQEKVDATMRQALAHIGGLHSFVSPGQSVLLKPNLLSAASPGNAITTHPAVVEAVVKLVQEAGGDPIIADSPGSTVPYNEKGLRRVYEATGMADVARRTGATLNRDTRAVEVSHPDGAIVRRLNVIKPVLDADVVINLPKLKTHVYTTFTGAVKNLFGVIPGYEKPAYHAKFHDLARFSEMLLDVLGFVKPDLAVIDGIIGLEGNGPGKHGKAKHVGILIAGKDSIMLDVVACRVVGLDPESVPVLTAAHKRGWWNGQFDKTDLAGNPIEEISIADFQKPSTSLDLAGYVEQKWLRASVHFLLKSAFAARPIPRRGVCTACGACVRACPQDAISIVGRLAVVDDDKCIRCYCCHELCPEGAIDLKLSWLGRLVQKNAIMRRKGGKKE